MKNRTWAPQLQSLLRTCFKSGGTFIDVGANIGLTLVPVASNRSVRCYGFEPEPLNFSYLARNVAANCKFDNVTLYSAGRCDPPPLKWSDLRYVFDIKEDCNGKEAIQA